MSGQQQSTRHNLPVEKLRDWFGSPVAAGKTLVWLLWVSFLGSICLGILLVLIAALPA
jgi:hypothetical protein